MERPRPFYRKRKTAGGVTALVVPLAITATVVGVGYLLVRKFMQWIDEDDNTFAMDRRLG